MCKEWCLEKKTSNVFVNSLYTLGTLSMDGTTPEKTDNREFPGVNYTCVHCNVIRPTFVSYNLTSRSIVELTLELEE